MKTCKGCKHYKKDERIGIKVCEFGLHESYCEKDKEDFAIEELEKIKEEMKKVSYQMININDEFYDLGFRIVDLEDINEVIENRIYELKGDNNTDCRNCDKWKTCENGEKGHANGTSIGYSIGECKDYAELKGE